MFCTFPFYLLCDSSQNNYYIKYCEPFSRFLTASVAVDWINDKIYWSDESTSRIEVAELSGSNRKTLIATSLQYPRGLVVDPSTR